MSDMDLLDFQDSETTCAICYAEFLDPDDLSVHKSQVHGEQTQLTLVQCPFCSVHLSDLANYALHLRDDHLPNLHCCKYCNRVFQDFDQYRKHESKHYTYVPKSMYSCSQCGKLHSNVFELELHERREHANATEGVLLNDCLPFLSSLLNIKALKFLQSLHDDAVYMCVNCEISTSNVQKYLEHLKKNKCQSPACDICGSVYRTKKNLIKHYQTHKDCFHNSQPRYKQCSECCKMFEIKMWRRHTKTCRPIKCRSCNIIYSTMNELAQHQSEHHPMTVVLETCKYCHREFAGTSALDKHIERTHPDLHLYKYKCIDCKAVFKHPKKLFAHFSSTHKDLEPYTCKICDKKFKVRKKFTIHIKLDHKSIGYIEFDKNFHVFFSDKKSENPFQPGAISNSHTVKSELKETSKVKDQKKYKGEVDQKTLGNKKVTFALNKDSTSKNEKVQAEINTTENQRFELNEEQNEEVNINSDFMSATETEGNQTENEADQKSKARFRSRKRRRPQNDDEYVVLESSDDEPLLELQKRAKTKRRSRLKHATWNRKQQVNLKNNKKRFICNICKKYCYTFQNYHNHYSTHYTNATLKCVKCSKSFKSKDDLNKHCSEEHSSSQLTQTLKNLLQKRKHGANPELTTAEKFQRTIKSVNLPPDTAKVSITTVNKSQSVKNFIESFTPEDAPKNEKSVEINDSVTMRSYVGLCKEPLIKMTKCKLTPIDDSPKKLSMPVHFRQAVGETYKVTIKQVSPEPIPDFGQDYTENDNYQSDNDKSEAVPEVAQEVMLEETEEPPKTLYIPHKVVLPKLPKEFNKVRIAHLQAEAPYYKIVKVGDVLNPKETKPKEKPVSAPKKDIQLPDGTKLVTVNPLAHLLGDTPVEKILANTKSKYYQPKPKDFEMAIAKAMLKLDNPSAFPKKKRKKSDAEK
ncbi:hypothetical protein ABMA27_012257 [Loxostege sticticalis]|uniref:C2H2-type domain-containing protein n=1 Tax=Loxostege sticticalis TaxID=481309 RepID=A0ABR3H126_LOXSC